MKPVKFHPEAEAELKSSVDFYDERVAGLGREFGQEVEAAVTLIQQGPQVWPGRISSTQTYVMRRFPFSIAYMDLADSIWVVAVAHGSRKPRYWEKRIRESWH